MTTTKKPSTLFWIIAIILVIWNLMGASAFIFDTFFTEMLVDSYDDVQIKAIMETPIWAKALYGIATIGGLLAALLLLARKLGAVRIYLISLIALITHTVYHIGFANGMEIFGTWQGLVFPLIVVVLAVFEYWWSKYSASKGWLN